MSTITVTNIQATGETASRAVSGVAAAWINYNQTVPQIDDSQNVASVTDSGAGDSTINFTNNMSAATFGATCGALTYNAAINTITVSGSRMLTYSGAGTLTDYSFVGYTAVGDLA